MKTHYAARELAAVLGVSERAVQKRARREGWPAEATTGLGGRRHLYPFASLPPDVQAAVIAALPPEAAASLSPEEAAALPASTQLAIAQRRAAEAIEDARAHPLQVSDPRSLTDGRVRRIAAMVSEAGRVPPGWTEGRTRWIAHVAASHGVSRQTLYRNMKALETAGLDGLLHGNQRSRRRRPAWSPEAVDYWKGLVLKREHRHMTLKALYGHLAAEAGVRRWRIGTYESALMVRDEIPEALLVYRDGGSRALDNHLPPIRRDYADLDPFGIIVGDQHRFDFWVRDDDTDELFRPEGYLWQDLCTRSIYGLALGRRYDSIMAGHALWTGLKIYGRFGCVYTDNGKPETSKYMLDRRKGMGSMNLDHATSSGDLPLPEDWDPETGGILADLGAGQRLAIVRNAKAKMIEGTFGVLDEILRSVCRLPGSTKILGATKEVAEVDQEDIDRLAGAGLLPTFTEFSRGLIEACDHYNLDRHHRGLADQWRREAGRAPSPCTPRAYLLHRVARGWRPSYVSDRALDLVFLARASRTVQRGRVQLHTMFYEAAELADLACGTRVELRYDPLDRERPVIVLRGGKYLCDATPMGWGSMVDSGLTERKIEAKREMHRRFREAYRRFTAPVPDLRRYSEVPANLPVERIEAAAAARETLRGASEALEREQARLRTPEELAAEVKALEAASGKNGGTPRKLPPRPAYFLTERDRFRWCFEYERAGGVLPGEDAEFMAEYQARMPEDWREYWDAAREVPGAGSPCG